MPKLMIAASGTGGHLFPALSVAEYLPSSWQITWLGVPDRLETKLVPSCYDLKTVQAGGIQARGIKKLFQLFQLLFASKDVVQLLKSRHIEVVFTTGGYIAAPAILAAVFCGIPVILHESNIVPGRVTRLFGRLCDFVAVGLPPTVGRLPRCKTIITGTPVRPEFLKRQLTPSWLPMDKGPLLVVMGGSQGAIPLNRMVRAVAPELLMRGCRIVHLTGENDPEIQQIKHPNFVEKPFSNEIPALLQHADLVISRAGASAISELAISGTPAILVPYPFATDQHQEINAAFAAENAAAVIVHQHQPENHSLLTTLNRLLKNRFAQEDSSSCDPLSTMRLGMQSLAIRDPDKMLTQLLNQVLQ